ncbi:hypothetical protein V502_02959 [Pseudogymnoascus sp. VKM F-4520 (FW-2644)]|nr:hypothetical protein V502_02959 [Pseudogymnoascus sp. VKM F-4520 (FW-2644)]
MTDAMTDPTLHSDLRAPSVAPRRAHAQAQKWKHTTQTVPTHWTASAPISTPIPRPQKQPRITRGPIPSRGTALAHAKMECADLSCGVMGWGEREALDDGVGLPPGVPVGDESIFYTFDSDASPASSLGLDGLVDKAELHFKERETEKIVRAEWEVLDGEGEKVGRRGKGKGSVDGDGGEMIIDGEVGGAWEAI